VWDRLADDDPHASAFEMRRGAQQRRPVFKAMVAGPIGMLTSALPFGVGHHAGIRAR